MTSQEHNQHIKTRVSHSNCSECRADTERQFVNTRAWRYEHVSEYVAYIRPRIEAIRNGAGSLLESRVWHRGFRKALHTRISAKVPRIGRKYCDSYLQRMGQFPRSMDAGYLRDFASRGASCLDC